ncbi:basic leucine zipper 4-like [Juglans microcarpa x Juglans regia]|uniref:basic leucine zipper 4-like n=1 Tax=Juglans microcarpa x Juglans regia TaxID=2249226 RepID=UPI001B7DF690|nr:basic leucine zipper 4-like [Juglans microcarpa x Juglans regia]
MVLSRKPVEFRYPVSKETGFTTDELQKLLSFFPSRHSVGQNSSTTSEDSFRAIYSNDEKKLRRMKSNRESAQRSRWRKKRHLADLKDKANQLKMENQELKNQLGLALRQSHAIGENNQELIFESMTLRDKLSNLYRILFTMQTPYKSMKS